MHSQTKISSNFDTHTQKNSEHQNNENEIFSGSLRKKKTNDLNLLAPAQTWPPPLIPLPRAANQKKNNNNLIIFNEIFVRLNLLTCCLFWPFC